MNLGTAVAWFAFSHIAVLVAASLLLDKPFHLPLALLLLVALLLVKLFREEGTR